ncbi:2,3-diaminopropionate biosynthesis protein SbnB [Cystobacter ferrugineus]|uniref:2,3-diaminopropionate biosynthesis protein SbnB n=1 Tax=Cystobacter ferrugineus TaxID=83449 RepID=A0A1L9AWC1_9BACT|nr:2,3-diaminopropionate biosynthesis protein SbnB [Cystobacter ferrugineus]OJH34309.1 2,3-diaminopropionate biosynthesis protein SbnB [Cystobacter ferrugineus]
MDFTFSVVPGKTIHSLVHANIPECIRQVEAAYLAHDDKQTVNPDSYFLRFPEQPQNRIIALPACLRAGTDVAGIKWIASWPGNIQRGIQRASAVLVLNDLETGYPFACLESSIISAARTAGSAVLAASWLNGRSSRVKSLAIIGNGFIARYIYEFMMELGWEIEELCLHDVAPTESERFSSQVVRKERHSRITVEADLASALRSSELIVLTTVAPKPYINDLALLAHHPIILNISLRDIAPEIILQSHNIVDDVEHVMKADTSPHLAEKLSGGRAFVNGTLAALIRGRCSVDRTRPTIFSPFGLGVLDLALGKWIYDEAVKAGTAIAIQDFFRAER